MIQDTEFFLGMVNSGMDYETTIKIIKHNGASQMTCTKVLMQLYGLRLSAADEIVQNSPQWSVFKKGNDRIKKLFFSDEDE